jgi:nucleoside-diphosphate-sugar epimerase
MQVFVTGGTGTIGSAVVPELLAAGHSVLALARSDTSARALADAGAAVLRGQLSDRDVLRAGAARSDGVISLAFGTDYSTQEALARSIAEETAALTVFSEELAGSDRPLVTVSGTPWVPGRAATEADPLPTEGRWVAAAGRSPRCWSWRPAGCAAPPSGCPARCTPTAGAGSPGC